MAYWLLFFFSKAPACEETFTTFCVKFRRSSRTAAPSVRTHLVLEKLSLKARLMTFFGCVGILAHNDGTASTLINLAGTIPIYYRGNQYNIPMEFWIVEAYPMAPPVCYVRPTSGARGGGLCFVWSCFS